MEENLQNDGAQGGNNFEELGADNLDKSADDNLGADNADDNNLGDNGSNIFSIPDEYQNKDWAKNFEGKVGNELKSEIFKVLDEKYASTPLVPETIEEYALSELEFKNETGEKYYEYPQEVLEVFGERFKNRGLTKEQAHGILTDYTEFEIEQFKAMTNVDDLNQSINEMFKSNQAEINKVEGLLQEFLPVEDRKFLNDSAPNHTLLMFYKVAKGLADKYGYKEGFGGQGGKSHLRMTEADKDKEYNRIVGELEALQKRPHTTEEHNALRKQLDSLFR